MKVPELLGIFWHKVPVLGMLFYCSHVTGLVMHHLLLSYQTMLVIEETAPIVCSAEESSLTASTHTLCSVV